MWRGLFLLIAVSLSTIAHADCKLYSVTDIKDHVVSKDSKLICDEGKNLPEHYEPVKIGHVYVSTLFNRDPKNPDPFTYRDTVCKYFLERYTDEYSILRNNRGIICQQDQMDWLVVDKW